MLIPAEEAEALEYNYNTTVRHGKGAVGIYLLAERVGKDRFLELQRKLLRRYAGRHLTPSALASALEDGVLDGARDWLVAWMRGDASIEYRIAKI